MEMKKPNRSIRFWKCFLGVPLTALWLFSALAAQPAQTGVLRDIQVAKNPSGIEITIILTADAAYRTFELTLPSRLVLDLPGIEKVAAPAEIAVEGGGVLRIRSGLFNRNTARIVFDTAGKMPRYEIVKISEGLRILFAAEPGAPPVQEDPAKVPPVKEEAVKPKDVEKTLAAEQERAKAAEKAAVDKRREEELKRAQEQPAPPADLSLREEPGGTQRTYRAAASLGPFFPGTGGLKDRYGIGLKIGVEINRRIADKIEIWLSASSLGQSAADEAAGQDRQSRLSSLLFGLNYRFVEGFVNPYLGVGAGYFFYSETFAGATSRELEFGLQGRAGVFLKLSRIFVLGLQAQYDHCRVTSNSVRIDPAGFHIGLIVGAEF